MRFINLLVLTASFVLLHSCDLSSPNSGAANELPGVPAINDTLSETQMETMLRPLPKPAQDTFFKKQLLDCYMHMDTGCLKRSILAYEKLRPGDPGVQATCLHVRGYMQTWASHYDSAEYYYANALKLSRQVNNDWLSARILISRSGNMSQMGNIEQDIRWKYEALEYANRSKDSSIIINVYLALANSLGRNQDYGQVKAIMKDLIPRVRDTFNLGYCYMIYGKSLAETQQGEDALVYMRKGLKIRVDLRMPTSTIFEGQYHIGKILNSLGRYQEALDTLRRAEQLLSQVTNRQMIPVYHNIFAQALEKTGNYADAAIHGKLALEAAESRKDYIQARQAAQTLYLVSGKTSGAAVTLRYHELYRQYQDSVYKIEKEKEIQQLNVKYESQAKEEKIKLLQRENVLARQRNWWIGICAFLIGFTVLFTYRLRAQRRRAQLEVDNELSEAQAQKLAQQVALQEIELESHKNNLKDFTQMLLERNTQIQELYQQINNIASNEQDGSMVLSTMSILTDQEWLQFQERFNRVYPGYIQFLQQQYPGLSASDTRFMLLDKINLSAKETASILGVGTDAVKKGRYRLRKKLNLHTDQPLQDACPPEMGRDA